MNAERKTTEMTGQIQVLDRFNKQDNSLGEKKGKPEGNKAHLSDQKTKQGTFMREQIQFCIDYLQRCNPFPVLENKFTLNPFRKTLHSGEIRTRAAKLVSVNQESRKQITRKL